MHCRVTPSTLSQAVGPGLHLESSSHTEYAAAGQALSTQKYASPGPGRRATNHMASFQFLSLSLSLSLPLSLSLSLSLPPSLPLLDLARGQENPARGGLSNPERGAGWGLLDLARGQENSARGGLSNPERGLLDLARGQENPARGGLSNPERGAGWGLGRGQKRTPKGVYGTQENPARGGTSSLDLSLSLSFFRQAYPLSLSLCPDCRICWACRSVCVYVYVIN